jgi:predicted dehydrogenase
VWIAAPDPLHEELTLACAAAGKHVLCEKPMATTAAAARRMVEACARAGVTLGIAYNNRHHAAHRLLFDWARRGELGRVLRVRALMSYRQPDASNWRARAPNPWWAMAAVGTHLVDLACALAGAPVTDVFARFSSPVFGAENEELAVVSIGFAGGASADVEAATSLPALPSRLEVSGTAGAVFCEDTIAQPGGTLWRDGAVVSFDPVDPYRCEVEDFARAAAAGREPEVGGAAGLRNIEILEAAARSAATGQRVEAP